MTVIGLLGPLMALAQLLVDQVESNTKQEPVSRPVMEDVPAQEKAHTVRHVIDIFIVPVSPTGVVGQIAIDGVAGEHNQDLGQDITILLIV